jgi:hypothetical protein
LLPATAPNSVGTGPGARTVHETPVPASSAWSASENDCTNAFVAAYVAMLGTGWKAASEATLRIAPARRSTIGRTNASVSSWTAATLTWTIAASAAGSASSTRPYEPKPALLHRPATNLSEPRTESISARRWAASARSLETASASTPCSPLSAVASSSRRSARRATRTRSWPSAASWRASAAPIPDDAPVTSTT